MYFNSNHVGATDLYCNISIHSSCISFLCHVMIGMSVIKPLSINYSIQKQLVSCTPPGQMPGLVAVCCLVKTWSIWRIHSHQAPLGWNDEKYQARYFSANETSWRFVLLWFFCVLYDGFQRLAVIKPVSADSYSLRLTDGAITVCSGECWWSGVSSVTLEWLSVCWTCSW